MDEVLEELGEKLPEAEVEGRLVEVVFNSDSFSCRRFWITFSVREGFLLRNDKNDKNSDDTLQEDFSRIPLSEITCIKSLENPLAFELHTRDGPRIFMFERFSLQNKLQPLLTRLITPQATDQTTTFFSTESVDPIKILNNDTFQVILSHFHTIRDFKSILLVNQQWNARFTVLVQKMTDRLIQNNFIEHQQNFTVTQAAKREKMHTVYSPVLIHLYSPKIILPLDGSFQTWKYNIALWSGKWYYEVVFGASISYVQMGWMSCQCDCKPSGLRMRGVGDDANSWCHDPTRRVRFTNDNESSYGSVVLANTGDAYGCLFDMDKKVISFTKNGEDLGPAYTEIDIKTPYYPGITRYQNAHVYVILHKENMKYKPPEGFSAVGEGISEQAVLVEALIGKEYLTHYATSTIY